MIGWEAFRRDLATWFAETIDALPVRPLDEFRVLAERFGFVELNV